MLLSAKDLLTERLAKLTTRRGKIAFSPGIALVWVGNDPPTAAFVRAKQVMAKRLDCQFFLHHFDSVSQHQLETVIEGLNSRPDIQGIVLQLPLPKSLDSNGLIAKITAVKDIDNLHGDSEYPSPTPSGIIELLKFHKVNLADKKTVILGAGPLVGRPLAEIFRRHHWPVTVIEKDAEKEVKKILTFDVIISATGVSRLVTPAMVGREMIVVDGSGVDIDVASIEPLVKAVTPARGAIGPLTVSNLFENLLVAAKQKA